MTASAAPSVSERVLLDRFKRCGDQHAREALVRAMEPLAEWVIPHTEASRRQRDDLRQAALLGLVKAIDRYDPAFGVPLRAYAIPTMRGEVLRHMRDHGWAIRPPRRLQEHALAVTQARERLWTRLGRSPTADEIGAELDLEVDEVLEAIEAGRSYHADHLDRPLGHGDDGARTLGETVGAEDREHDRVEARVVVGELMPHLTDREATVVFLRFELDLTQREIGERIGLSQMEISRILRRALDRLRPLARGERPRLAPRAA